ncbi:MAG: S1 family peptidase [Pseudolysinimonas sp.]
MSVPLRVLALSFLLLVPAAPAVADDHDTSYTVGSTAKIAVSPAEAEDLRTLAGSLGISFDEARDRFAGQELFAAAVDVARRTDPQAFSTATWTPESEHSAEIAFVGTPSPKVAAALAALPYSVAVSEDAARTEADFEKDHIAIQEAIAALPGVARVQSWGDPATGRLTVTYDTVAESVATTADAVTATAARVARGQLDLELIPGGAGVGVLTAIVGGNPLLDCTAGFTVTSVSSTGVSTAAHCDNGVPQTYYGGSYATFGAASAASNGDLQWHKFVGAVAVTNKFRYTSAGGERFVTSATNPVAGSAICYWGKTSGNHCGTVQTANLCDSSWCRLFSATPSTLQPGDSGGPWYYGNVGKGISHGYVTNGIGVRLYDLATQIGAHSYLGLAVKVTP